MQALFRWLRMEWWYLRKPPWDTGISPPELYAYIASHLPGRALDLGCGTGTNVLTLARAGWQTSGVDISRLAIALAQRRLRQAEVTAEVRVGDVTRLDGFEGGFDFVLDMGCYHHLASAGRQAYRTGINRLLRPGGGFMMYAHHKNTPADPHGIDERDMERFAAFLRLIKRSDGWERGIYPSLWLEFHKENG